MDELESLQARSDPRVEAGAFDWAAEDTRPGFRDPNPFLAPKSGDHGINKYGG